MIVGTYTDATGRELPIYRRQPVRMYAGLRVTSGPPPYPQWTQPIIDQPEAGILGILVKEIDGVLHTS